MGSSQAIIFLTYKFRITNNGFLTVNWEEIEEAMESLAVGANYGLVKFSSIFCGMGRMMNIMGAWKPNIFLFFLKEVETTSHILKYHHPYIP